VNERRDSGKEQGSRRIARARRKKAKVSNLLLAFIRFPQPERGSSGGEQGASKKKTVKEISICFCRDSLK